MKKLISGVLAVIMLLSVFVPAVAAQDFALGSYGIIAGDGTLAAADYLRRAVSELCGATLPDYSGSGKKISLVLEGEETDYSVSLDESTGDVTLTGGGEDALLRAVYAFLTAVCAGEVTPAVNYSYDHSEDGTDNSGYLKYRGGANAEAVTTYFNGLLSSPKWMDSLVMVEVRPDTASIGGTFAECKKLIDHYAVIGVNGIWLTPIYDKGSHGNGYSNYGPHTVDPRLSGTDDYSEGRQEVRKLVDYAHSKGIYIFLDVITWGVVYDAPLIAEHPDWFNGEAWGNIAFDWTNEELRNWFVETLVNNILTTGADGYRCDCEPNYTGYDIFGKVRKTLAEKEINISVISEDFSERRSAYDMEQDGVFDYSTIGRGELYVSPENFFVDGRLKIVDAVRSGNGIGRPEWDEPKIKRGAGRYYTNCITNHDYQRRDVCGNRLKIGYAAVLAPFIPLWYMGDEFNVTNVSAVLYDIPVDFSEAEKTSNAFFLEDVKRMLRIRREYDEIFEKWALNHRNSNICEVKVDGLDSLQSYARYADGRAVLVIPNNDPTAFGGRVKIPFSKCALPSSGTFTVTDLMTGQVILTGTKKEIDNFTAFVPYQHAGVYLIESDGDAPGFSIEPGILKAAVSEFFCSLYIKFKMITEK